MTLPTSGALAISSIRNELGTTNGSLRTLSNLAGKSTPDSISEFYGYSASTTHITFNVDNFFMSAWYGSYYLVGMDKYTNNSMDDGFNYGAYDSFYLEDMLPDDYNIMRSMTTNYQTYMYFYAENASTNAEIWCGWGSPTGRTLTNVEMYFNDCEDYGSWWDATGLTIDFWSRGASAFSADLYFTYT